MGKIKEMTTTILQIAPIKTKIFQGIVTLSQVFNRLLIEFTKGS